MLIRPSGSDWLIRKRELRLVWMTYELEFDLRALKEWKAGRYGKAQFKKKLADVLVNPESNRPALVCLIATKSNSNPGLSLGFRFRTAL
jgi:hypothetical protein